LLERTRRSRLCFNSCVIVGAPLSVTLAFSYEARFNDLLPAYDRMRLGRLGAANCHEGDNECKLGVPVAGK
jgi:hypothetical protein